MTALPVPKAAQQLLDDAKAAGLHANLKTSSVDVTVSLSDDYGNAAYVIWEAGVFYGKNTGPLGFHTRGGSAGVRFSYASGEHHSPRYGEKSRYWTAKSVAQVRSRMALPN